MQRRLHAPAPTSVLANRDQAAFPACPRGALFLGGFLFFLGFARATAPHQSRIELKTPLLVGFFLAGLVIHGGWQGWWIAPVLSRLPAGPLFLGAAALTADNGVMNEERTMIEFKHILCPIDFSETSIRALTYAAAVAAWYEGQLEVLHVVPALEDDPASRPSGSTGESSRPTSRDAILSEIRRSLESVAASTVNPHARAEEGRPHEVIVTRAQAQPADLVVMGTHGRCGFNRLLLGSVAEKVLRTAPCPVLTVPGTAPALTAAAVSFKRIVCAIDYSPSAIKALQYALELGRQADGCVTVLYALEYLDPEEPCEHVDFDIRRRRQHFIEHARQRLHALLAQEPTTWCEIDEVVAIDRAYKAILQHATAAKADLIVMGAQGTGGVELMLYGSNTQHVVRSATCPVLTVHV